MEVIVTRKDDSGDELPVWNERRLLERLGNDTQLVREMLRVFDEEMPELLGMLFDGLDAGNREVVERAAHAMKGAALNLEAVELAGICGEFEKSAFSASWDRLREQAGSIRSAYERFMAIVSESGRWERT
ncbi:MAG: Hpt domain-containing protein [Deltaproteobacteria bacterium]|nr:MAG: Hpt domain-containing protein [Deltaproteobacteria bacterium]